MPYFYLVVSVKHAVSKPVQLGGCRKTLDNIIFFDPFPASRSQKKDPVVDKKLGTRWSLAGIRNSNHGNFAKELPGNHLHICIEQENPNPTRQRGMTRRAESLADASGLEIWELFPHTFQRAIRVMIEVMRSGAPKSAECLLRFHTM